MEVGNCLVFEALSWFLWRESCVRVTIALQNRKARVAKLADAPDLGSGGAILRGSSPLPGTMSPDRRGRLSNQLPSARSGSLSGALKGRATFFYGCGNRFPPNACRRERRFRSVHVRFLLEAYQSGGHCRRRARRNRQ